MKDISLSSYKSYNGNHRFVNNLSVDERKALNNLIKGKNIIIQKTDKGNTVVITDRNNYTNGVKSVISDKTKFVSVDTPREKYLNYIINSENRFKTLFKNFLDKKTSK